MEGIGMAVAAAVKQASLPDSDRSAAVQAIRQSRRVRRRGNPVSRQSRRVRRSTGPGKNAPVKSIMIRIKRIAKRAREGIPTGKRAKRKRKSRNAGRSIQSERETKGGRRKKSSNVRRFSPVPAIIPVNVPSTVLICLSGRCGLPDSFGAASVKNPAGITE